MFQLFYARNYVFGIDLKENKHKSFITNCNDTRKSGKCFARQSYSKIIFVKKFSAKQI